MISGPGSPSETILLKPSYLEYEVLDYQRRKYGSFFIPVQRTPGMAD